MHDEVRERLDQEIMVLFDNLESPYVGGEDYSETVGNIVKLYNLRMTEDKESKKENKSDRWIEVGLRIAEIIVPLSFYALMFRTGMRFEETGNIVSPTFKRLLGHIRPTSLK